MQLAVAELEVGPLLVGHVAEDGRMGCEAFAPGCARDLVAQFAHPLIERNLIDRDDLAGLFGEFDAGRRGFSGRGPSLEQPARRPLDEEGRLHLGREAVDARFPDDRQVLQVLARRPVAGRGERSGVVGVLDAVEFGAEIADRVELEIASLRLLGVDHGRLPGGMCVVSF